VAGVRIRPAELTDAREIAEVHVRGWRWGYRDLLPMEVLDSLSVERRERGWNEILRSLPPDATVLVADLDGRIVGFAGVGPCRDQDAPEGTGSSPPSTSRRSSAAPESVER
jgi:hypothetical protein